MTFAGTCLYSTPHTTSCEASNQTNYLDGQNVPRWSRRYSLTMYSSGCHTAEQRVRLWSSLSTLYQTSAPRLSTWKCPYPASSSHLFHGRVRSLEWGYQIQAAIVRTVTTRLGGALLTFFLHEGDFDWLYRWLLVRNITVDPLDPVHHGPFASGRVKPSWAIEFNNVISK